MHTDTSGTIRLKEFSEEKALLSHIEALPSSSNTVVFLEGSLDDWENLKSALLRLRANNLSPIVQLTPSTISPSVYELEGVVQYLRDWDQLFLGNIITLFMARLPREFVTELEVESKFEARWFKEWFTASTDQRIAKYPGLPWRSFIRKTIQENFEFALGLLKHGMPESEDYNEINLRNFIRGFLRAKKKAINTYPKKWGKVQ